MYLTVYTSPNISMTLRSAAISNMLYITNTKQQAISQAFTLHLHPHKILKHESNLWSAFHDVESNTNYEHRNSHTT